MGSNENNTNKQKKKGKAGKIIKIIVIVLLVLILIPILILVGAVLFGGGICGFGGLGGIALWLFNQEKEVTPDNSDDSYYIEVSIDDVPDEISGGDSYIESVEVVDRELVSVELAALPDRLDYYINDELDITGMELIAKYDDGSEKDVTDSVMVNPVILSKAGTQTVTVSYIDYTTTFTVNVKKEGIEWSLKNGTLTIIGRGPMDDYDQYSAADWKMRKDDIVEIVIEKGVTSVGDFAFAECENLKRVTLPEGLVSIGESAFNSCPLLESVNLPNGLKSVDAWAFGGCSSIEVFEIPASVSSIADYAFAPCEMLTAINVDEDNSYYSSHYGVLLNKKQTKLIQYPENKENTKYAVPETVTTICKAAFYSCNRLVEINFDDDITVIEDYALYDSEHLTRINYNGTMSRWKTIRFGTQWRYNTDFDIIYCTDGELYLNGSSDGDNNGGGGNSGGIVYRTSVAGTNYARRATYSVSKEGETDPSYIYVGGAWSDWSDSNCTKLNDGVVGDCSTYSASTGALAGVSVLYASTNRAFEFVFDLGDYYGDIRKLVFRQARHGTPNGNNRGFEVMLIQVSDDGVNWTRAKGTLSAVAVPNAVELEDMQGETTNVEHYDFTYTLDSVAKAKYVRVILSNDGGYVLQLEEIEIRN